jgi:Domain of unknown function (DUF4062)
MLTKYQVFISSTYQDLRDEREHVIKAILEMGHIPLGMEMFSAADDAQWNIIKRQIDQSDYYLVLVANRYGSTSDAGISYTEQEYDYALQQLVPAIGFILDPSALWLSDRNEVSPKLDAFKEKLKKRLVSFWKSADDLSGKVVIALSKLMTERPRPDWVRGSEVPSVDVLNEMSRLSKENAELREELAKHSEDHHITEVITSLEKRTLSKEVPELNMSLLSFFRTVARQLTVETRTVRVVLSLTSWAFRVANIREEDVREWLMDLVLLDLVASRTERLIPASSIEWWQVTSLGKKTLARIGNAERQADDSSGMPNE